MAGQPTAAEAAVFTDSDIGRNQADAATAQANAATSATMSTVAKSRSDSFTDSSQATTNKREDRWGADQG